MKEPKVKVGIMFGPEIRFRLHTLYLVNGKEVTGMQRAVWEDGRIRWNGCLWDRLEFLPADYPASSFELEDVTIGIHFHWERTENQIFQGAFSIVVENGHLTGINTLLAEDYLTSVISSEMSASASLELLKAHAVISRSWLLAQMMKDKRRDRKADTVHSGCSAEEHIVWYDKDDHMNFDVCADDHCQRYQGLTKVSTESARNAVRQTRGEVLVYQDEICDARFSKCCGGALEEFATCWEDADYPYLQKRPDCRHDGFLEPELRALPDLKTEENARDWILGHPEAFCDTADAGILSQVLNQYDRETTDFYRWHLEYSQKQLADLIRRKSGQDFGDILDLEPVERGTSGRLCRLRIVGTRKTQTVGKELEIRRLLSESHLYSSAFVVEKHDYVDGVPQRFVLHGAGWGHGVGLCQIGAAVMGESGYDYSRILLHYYLNAGIRKIYD